MTSQYDKFGGRAILMALAILLAVIGAMVAKAQEEQQDSAHDGEAPNEAPITIQTESKQLREDSVFAAIDENFKLVKPIFEQACFDCHSTLTKYPWYHKVPGIKQLLDGDVKEGREHMDFTDGFPFASKKTPLEQLNRIKREVDDGDMPPLLYRLMHWSAWLNRAEKDSVIEWSDSSSVLITRFYDSEQIPYMKPDTTGADEDED